MISYSDHDGIGENELVEPLDEDENLNQLFEKVYYECRLEQLFEQVLREMAVATIYEFSDWLEDRVKKALNNKSLNDTTIKEAIKNIIDNNNRTSKPPAPFAVLDNANQALVFTEASEIYKQNLNQYKENNPQKIKALITSDKNDIEKWIIVATNQVLQNKTLSDKIKKILNTNNLSYFIEIVKNNFTDLYIALQKKEE